MPADQCVVPHCYNKRHITNAVGKLGDRVSYFQFPRVGRLREIWANLCGYSSDWIPTKSDYVCSVHFKESDFERDLKAELMGSIPKKILRHTATPSRNLCLQTPKKEAVMCSVKHCENNNEDVSNGSVSYHKFPLKQLIVLKKWIAFTNEENFSPTEHSYICSLHFQLKDYVIIHSNGGMNKILKRSAIPSITPYELTQEAIEEPEEVNNHSPEEELTSQGDAEHEEEIQLLIVNENGEIVNSDIVLKEDDIMEVEEEELMEEEDDNTTDYVPGPEKDDEDNEEEGDDADDDQDFDNNNDENDEDDEDFGVSANKLKGTRKKVLTLTRQLKTARNKIKMLQQARRRYLKRITDLKELLQLLVFKRGRGKKSLTMLVNEYEHQ